MASFPVQPSADRKCSRESPAEGSPAIAEELRLLVTTDDSSSDALGFAGLPTCGRSVSPSGDSVSYRPPSTSPRRLSPSEFTAHQDHGGRSSTTLERSRSISTVLFTKVKERIVETMFQTATEGPHLAAIVQERRQRAADEYEARFQTGAFKAHRKDQQQQHGGGNLQVDERYTCSGSSSRKIRRSLGSSPIKDMTIDEEEGEVTALERIQMARAAFRRRSVSQDAAHMETLLQPSGVHEKVRAGSERLNSSSCRGQNSTPFNGSQAFEGIICSNNDFQAILMMGQQDNIQTAERQPCQKPRLGSKSHTVHHDQFQSVKLPSETAAGHGFVSKSSILNERVNSAEFNGRSQIEDSSDKVSCAILPSGPGSISQTQQQESEDGGLSPASAIFGTFSSVISEQHGGRLFAGQEDGKLASVPEIEYDENGQTWDVYGAEFDPEILGDAIQLHLKRLIERKFFDVQQQQADDTTDNSKHAKIDKIGQVDRKRSFRMDAKGIDGTKSESNRFFRYLCVFGKSRQSSDETI